MEKKYIFLVLVTIFSVSGCARKKDADKKIAQSYYRLALVELSEHGESEHSLKSALSLVNKALVHDSRAEFQALKATILLLLDKEEASEKSFDQALSLCADEHLRGDILNNYACFLASKKNYQKALALWEQIEHDTAYMTPEVALVNRAKIYAEQGDLGQAKCCLIDALRKAHDYLDAHYYLGIIAHRLGDLALAKNQLSTVLFLEPDHSAGRELMKQLEHIV